MVRADGKAKAQPRRQSTVADVATAVAGAAVAAAHAVVAATEASTAQPTEQPTDDNSDEVSVPWPPPPSELGYRWWFARGCEPLTDGVYILTALQNRGVDGDKPVPRGQLQGWKTCEPALKRASETGVSITMVYWK